MDQKKRALEIIDRLEKEYPAAGTALRFNTPFEMLVATILSAQCTDERVNKITADLFKKFGSPDEYANIQPEALEREIRSAGFYKNKAKSIIGSARMVIDQFGGNVPRTMPEIIRLPGVQRKTANVVLSEAYNVIDGIAVDTHVKRLSNRLALSDRKDPNKIEADLMALLPKEKWYATCNTLIYHGRRICSARNAKCAECVVNDLCPSAFKV